MLPKREISKGRGGSAAHSAAYSPPAVREASLSETPEEAGCWLAGKPAAGSPGLVLMRKYRLGTLFHRKSILCC